MRPPRRRWPAAAALFLFILLARGAPGARAGAAPPRPHVLDHAAFAYFAVELGAGADPEAVAVDAGLELVGPLPPLDGHWLLRAAHPPGDLAARSLDPDSPSSHHGRLLRRVERHPNVEWASLQVPKRRLFRRELPKRSVYGKAELNAIWKDQLDIKDPGAPRQWHLYNPDSIADDLNVTGVWMQGITGSDTIVGIIDDGLDYSHPDLKDAFVLEGSWDFNGPDPSSYPKPRLADDRHGTRCAGEVAARRNDKCGVGVAYNANVSGIRILSADITEVDEAASITYGYQVNQIYSCSWGPADDGRTVDGPPPLVAKAFREGIERGRGGLGSIYVFATGNGGGFMDNCNFDGYTNSLYTITIGAIDRQNNHPQYSETCSAQLAVTYSSSGGFANGAIYTTDVMPAECTDHHGGTSAAAPLAAGVMALVLSVRPDLHWRDLQRLLMETARPDVSLNDPDWVTVPSGRKYNHKFGYGRIDTYAIVEAAKGFRTLGPHTWFQAPYIHAKRRIPQSNEGLSSSIKITAESMEAVSMYRLEHVTVSIALEHTRRGDVELRLISPGGMVSVLATPRPYDTSGDGLRNWTFMTVKHWDENPAGVWTLKVLDQSNPGETGTLLGWTMRLWGEAPEGVLPNPVPLPPGRTLVTTKTNRPPPKTTTTTTKAPPPPPPPPATTTTTEPPSTGSQPSNDTSSDGQPSSRSPGLFALIGVAVFVALAGGVIYHLRRKVTRPDEPKDWEFQQLDDMGDDDIDGFLDDLGDDELDEGLQSARGYQFKNNGAAV